VEALLVLTKNGYNVTLRPRPGSKDPDLAAAQLCETLARLYPDLEPGEIRSMARRYGPLLFNFGRRAEPNRA